MKTTVPSNIKARLKDIEKQIEMKTSEFLSGIEELSDWVGAGYTEEEKAERRKELEEESPEYAQELYDEWIEEYPAVAAELRSQIEDGRRALIVLIGTIAIPTTEEIQTGARNDIAGVSMKPNGDKVCGICWNTECNGYHSSI